MNFRRSARRWPLALAAALLLSGSAYDPERNALPPPPPRLELPPGGVLFAADFTHDGLARWSPDRDGVWSVRHGLLRGDLPDERQLRSLIYAGDSSWTDVAVDVDVCAMRGVDKGVVVRAREDAGLGVDLRGGGYQDLVVYSRAWPLGHAPATNGNGTWNHLRVEVHGDKVAVYVNGERKLVRNGARGLRPSGRIALPAYTGGVRACTVYYDNVVVTALR